MNVLAEPAGLGGGENALASLLQNVPQHATNSATAVVVRVLHRKTA